MGREHGGSDARVERRRGTAGLGPIALVFAIPTIALLWFAMGSDAVALVVVPVLLGLLLWGALLAVRFVGHGRRSGSWSISSWWSHRHGFAVPTRLRVWPSAGDEPLRAQLRRGRWARHVRAVSPIAFETLQADLLARSEGGSSWAAGAKLVVHPSADGFDLRLSRTRPTSATVAATITAIPGGSELDGWVVPGRRSRWEPLQSAIACLLAVGYGVVAISVLLREGWTSEGARWAALGAVLAIELLVVAVLVVLLRTRPPLPSPPSPASPDPPQVSASPAGVARTLTGVELPRRPGGRGAPGA